MIRIGQRGQNRRYNCELQPVAFYRDSNPNIEPAACQRLQARFCPHSARAGLPALSLHAVHVRLLTSGGRRLIWHGEEHNSANPG